MTLGMALRPKSVNFEEKWSPLEETIGNILKPNYSAIPKSKWDKLFSDVYAICVAVPEPLGDQLYMRTKTCLEHHVEKIYHEVKSSGNILSTYHDFWKTFSKGTEYLDSLFLYLNKQHIRRQKYSDADLTYGGLTVDQIKNAMLEIGELALDIWRTEMIEKLEDDLVRELIEVVERERNGYTMDFPHSVPHGVVDSFVLINRYKTRNNLELYEVMFEAKYLESTSNHFKRKAEDMLGTCPLPVYMEKVIKFIEEENRRSRKFLHSSSYDKVTEKCQEVMVAAHRDRLYAVSKELVEQEKRDDLKNMYRLLKPISQGLTVLVKEVEDYAKKMGLNAVHSLQGESIPNQFVENILEVYNKLKNLVSDVFNDDQEFLSAMDKALQAAVNYKKESQPCPKASEWLAKYSDILLKKSAKGLSESEVEIKLASAIIIFRYIEDKDIFQKYYSRMLAQRLIHGVSVSMDAEEMMINKLKHTCGYEFTSKLQRMFTDIGLSRELTNKLNDFIRKEGETLEVPVQMQVLQQGAWPLSGNQAGTSGTTFAIPSELQPSITLFEKFYRKDYSGRKLNWLYNFSTAEVKLNYLDKNYMVTMSVFQLSVMLFFNDILEGTVKDIAHDTGLAMDTLPKLLKSLVDNGLLMTDNKEALGSDSTIIKLNQEYTNKRLKLKILTSVFQKQAEKESEHVSQTLQQDRKHFLECTIVRVMKTRKILKHNPLVQEVIMQSKSRFTPDIPFIKKIIESLIEKQYIQRTDSNDEYSYLA